MLYIGVDALKSVELHWFIPAEDLAQRVLRNADAQIKNLALLKCMAFCIKWFKGEDVKRKIHLTNLVSPDIWGGREIQWWLDSVWLQRERDP